MENKHISVLLEECLEGLNVKKDGIYVDLTLGRAGHSSEILKRLSPKGLLIGIDQDKEAIAESDIRLSKIASNYRLVKSNFLEVKDVLESLNIKSVDGILMDLGVSSPQFDDASRGFSYRYDAPLDMRMNQDQELTAAIILNTYSEKELCKIFQEYGEDKYSYQIAKNVVKERNVKPIETTFELVEIIKRSKPSKELKKVGHPAKQIFQALRIAVNDELNVLYKTLPIAASLLNSDGRLAVITFHSGEDKIVKTIFKNLTVSEGNRYDLPDKIEEKDYYLLNRKVIVPTEIEMANNHRSVSAKLRILVKK